MVFPFLSKPLWISSPTLGILDLSQGSAQEDISFDKEAIAEYFSAVEESCGTTPLCNVLFVYCTLHENGFIAGGNRHPSSIIRESSSRVAVFASNNPTARYIAATGPDGRERYGSVNIVFTIDRDGHSFPRFFGKLFGDMARGTAMPKAWSRIAPQAPGAQQAGVPRTIFACYAGDVKFR